MHHPTDINDCLLKQKAVLRILGISRTTLWKWRRQGIVPEPYVVINGRNYWSQFEIDDCLRNLPISNPADARAPALELRVQQRGDH